MPIFPRRHPILPVIPQVTCQSVDLLQGEEATVFQCLPTCVLQQPNTRQAYFIPPHSMEPRTHHRLDERVCEADCRDPHLALSV